MSKRSKQIRAAQQLPPTGLSIKPQSGLKEDIRLSFRYVDPGGPYCLSQCTQSEIKQFKECLRKLGEHTIQMLYSTSAKDPRMKQGLAWEVINEATIKKVKRPQSLDPSLKIGCVRATQKMRLFLSQGHQVFYVLWFDRNHEICSS